MTEVGIRALKQNASGVVAAAAAGETITITDRGRPVAQITPLPVSPLAGMLESGQARPPTRSMDELPEPRANLALSAELARMRDDERF